MLEDLKQIVTHPTTLTGHSEVSTETGSKCIWPLQSGLLQ